MRLTDQEGNEVFKLVENNKHNGFQVSKRLYNLTNQAFYQKLNSVKDNEFYFSSLEPNIVNGKIENPLRPTIRISKRIVLANSKKALLILNIDGAKILDLFEIGANSTNPSIKKHLIDSSGFYIASYPRSEEKYAQFKKQFPAKFIKDINQKKEFQGSIDSKQTMVVFSKLSLPNTKDNWLLITKVPHEMWEKIVFKKRLTWIFWEIVFFFVTLIGFWKIEKKRYQNEVVEVLLKERTEFMQNVSHQLKTPLAIILNSLSERESSAHTINEIRKEVKHLVTVVDDMLLLALVESSADIPLNKQNILDLLIEAVDMTGERAKEKGVSIRLNVDEKIHDKIDTSRIPVMEDLFISAIRNLLDNAIDFSPKGDVVEVYLTKEEESFIIQIKDSGPGIPHEFVPKLFERFTRIKTKDRKGSGLGLSITKKIIDLHNGSIQLKEDQKGTTFEIRL